MLDWYIVLAGVVFFLMMTVLVAAHELGHYLVARMFGMEVEAFAIMVGGVRKTDLRSRLEKPLVPGWVVAAVLIGLIVCWDLVMRFAGKAAFAEPLVLAIQVGVVLVVPLWIASRLAGVYHVSFTNIAKRYVFGWLGWLLAATAFGATKNMAVTGLLPLLAPVSALGLIFTYYIPVLNRQDEDSQGKGQIVIDGETTPVEFRPVAAHRAKSGTEYAMLLLPFGGFARIKGMQPKDDGSEVNVPNGFFSKAPWKRFLVLFGGPLFSIVAGALLLAGLYATTGVREQTKEAILGDLVEKSAAVKAGLKKDDRVLRIDDQAINSFEDMRNYVSPRGGQTIIFEVKRADQILKVPVALAVPTEETPVQDADGKPTGAMKKQARIGAFAAIVKTKLPLREAIVKGFVTPIEWFGQFVGKFAQPAQLKDEVGGMAAVAAATDAAVRSPEGLEMVMGLAAALSISLGIFNLLPIYPLDGGQMLVALAEMFRRGKRLSMKVQNTVATLGIALICMLVLFVLVNDTKRLSGADKVDTPAKTAPKSDK